MTDLAPHVTAFLCEYLPRDRRASRHTIASYAFSFTLLVGFAAEKLGKRPSRLAIEQLSVQLILDFLDTLEKERNNSARTRNLRLVAIKSFFRYLEFKVPQCLELAQRVDAIPIKRFDQVLVDYLEWDELQAILDAPDTKTTTGVRDRAMLYLTYAAGLRVSEVIGLKCQDLGHNLETVHVMGKGRRQRILPLWKTTQSLLRDWLAIRPDDTHDYLFLNARGKGMSRHGFAHRLALHVAVARQSIPSLAGKRVSPHVIRHSCAMHALEVTNSSVHKVSLWLGHSSAKTTEIYVRGDPIARLEMLAGMAPPNIRKGDFRNVPDELMAMLDELKKA